MDRRIHSWRTVSVVAAAVALAGAVSYCGSAAAEPIAPAGCATPDLWTVPTRPAESLTMIVAYSFGYRSPADPSSGDHEPGPVNEALADAVVVARGARDIPVFAQSEIAAVLRSRYAMHDVISIDGDTNPDGSPIYLSTEGVAAKVAALRGSARDTDIAGVVAFRDHLWRATRTTSAAGFTAGAPADVPMPDRYDPWSAQPWTTGPERYLPVDYAGRLKFLMCR
ncbi:hypothetical protein [Nocardia brasiliensis]|uniref:hypothetical protein n=1 Tax=Nocardia brasiliensis TaxID=37326 RepID=UPI001892FA0B|nr:hypothetical protein [Nocardia brasiliensis]MBF6541555.1 hypothetical protein [Nocardia brasiliensis]